jgi:integrase
MQARLFDLPPSAGVRPRHPAGKLDCDSETLLELFRGRRLANGAESQTVAREVSQLRSLAREATAKRAAELRGLFSEARALARALLEPAAPIASATGRARLVAAQRFVRACGREIGIDASAFLDALDALLPARTPRDWHTAGTLVAGTRTRQRPLGPTLYPQDLDHIVAAAGRQNDYRGLRRSAVRPAGEGAEVVIVVQRDRRLLRLPFPAHEAGPLLVLCRGHAEGEPGQDSYLFRRGESAERPLTTRAVRTIVQGACARAGYPLASAADLRAAFAYWLRLRGLSDHEAAAVLGLHQVRTLDRLLARHAALDAQRMVREACAL